MKTFLFSLLFFPLLSFGQIIVDKTKDLSADSTIQYIVVETTATIKKISVQVDYGQVKTISRPGALYDQEGRFKQFYSLAGVLNYFYQQNWQLISIEGSKAIFVRS